MMRTAPYLGISSWLIACLWLATSCTQNLDHPGGIDEDQLPPSVEGIGEEAWSSRDITCSNSDDCSTNEACIDNVCQIQRCGDGPYDSVAPLGERMTLANDYELIVADSQPHEGAYYLDPYESNGHGLNDLSSASWNFGSSPVVAIAGGDLYDERPEVVAAAFQNDTDIRINRRGSTEVIDVTFQPIALAAGDVDGNGADEIIALSADGQFALCKAPDGECRTFSWNGNVEGIDVTAADIDGDGFAEVIFLAEHDGDQRFTIWNAHYEQTGEEEYLQHAPDNDHLALAAGDLSGDGIAEVVGLGDNAWYNPFDSDPVTVYQYDGSQLAKVGDKGTGSGSASDITIGDLDMSGTAELAVLHDDRQVSVYRQSGDVGDLTKSFETTLSATGDGVGITTADTEGNSPSVERVSGPELIPGDIVPVFAANFPPYDEARSSGGDQATGVGGGTTSYLFLGDSETESETFADTTYTRWGAQVGVGLEFELFGIGAGGGVQGRFQSMVENTQSTTTTQVLGNRFHVTPQPEVHGHDYGVVMLSAGCFHGYDYEFRDPAGRMDSEVDGGSAFGIVPVDGQITLWSTPRYNALASELDYLPTIDITTEIGNPESYPRQPERADGTPVPPEKMVFTDPPEYLVSDTGTVGWWLSQGESEAQAEAMSTERGILTEGKLGVVRGGYDHHWGAGESHEIGVGSEVLFGGGVPPISDDPNTPESEYEQYAFPFAPYVYQKEYIDPDGDESAFYVLNFTVGDR